ncbi:hypothetical protein AB0H69_48985, partial [Streptomyces phaeochromogenes]|uniref:hypothetical protein n=1 Tax=Streptomyces phaeochromogenes TaxID=1923 RepID=UPI0033C3304C
HEHVVQTVVLQLREHVQPVLRTLAAVAGPDAVSTYQVSILGAGGQSVTGSRIRPESSSTQTGRCCSTPVADLDPGDADAVLALLRQRASVAEVSQ